MADATFRGTPEQLQRLLERLPALLTAQGGQDAQRLARAVGVEMLSIVKEAYITKARGGTDEAGIKWLPLDPRTIAYGRRHKGLTQKRNRAAKAGRTARPLLTASQDALWRRVFARCVAQGDDKQTAAMKAWGAAKRAGGKTIIGQYGGASVEIGRDTSRLINSLSPGAKDCILDASAGAVRVGSNVEYAQHFHAKRPIWPNDPAGFPDAWLERLGGIMSEFLANWLKRKLGGG